MAIKYEKSKKVLGAGRLFFEETNSLGVPVANGEVYLGDSPGFSLNITSTSVEDMSSDGPVAEKDIDIVVRVDRNFSLTTKNISFDNLALFVIGGKSTVTQVATPVVSEPISAVQQGRFYTLGVSTTNPTGVRGVTAVTVTDDAGSPTTFDEGDDYELDAATGRIRIVPGGGIANDTNLEVSYTPVAGSRTRVASNALGAKYGRLRYVEDATFGEPRDVYAPFVQLKPTGEMQFKSRDTVQSMGWDVSAMTPPAGGEAIYIEGRTA